MNDRIERMRIEYLDLKHLYLKLRDFIESEKKKELSMIAEYLLIKQYQAMAEYLQILKLRLAYEGVIIDDKKLYSFEVNENDKN